MSNIMTLPRCGGLGLKAQHFIPILETRPAVGWFEIHPENYLCAGGPPHRYLQAIREHYPLSMHGVGMSLGSADGISEKYLQQLKSLINRYQPTQISEHIAWSRIDAIHLNDLLPLPYTREALDVICDNLDRAQTYLGQTLLIENPSTYIGFKAADFTEPEFINEVCSRSGAGLLLDINNIYVSACNNGFDPYQYVDSIDLTRIAEVHLAGHAIIRLPDNQPLRIDDHGSAVKEEVWMLYEYLIQQTKTAFPTLIEWDNNIPELDILMAEMQQAESRMTHTLQEPAP